MEQGRDAVPGLAVLRPPWQDKWSWGVGWAWGMLGQPWQASKSTWTMILSALLRCMGDTQKNGTFWHLGPQRQFQQFSAHLADT